MEQETLIRLDETDFEVASPSDDVRGMMVKDRDGEEIGEVDNLLIDEQEKKVRFLEVGSGGFLGIGGERRLIPVDAVTDIDDEAVHVDKTRDSVAGSPAYDPEVVRTDSAYYGGLYGYYGYPPFWSAGYIYPGAYGYPRRP